MTVKRMILWLAVVVLVSGCASPLFRDRARSESLSPSESPTTQLEEPDQSDETEPRPPRSRPPTPPVTQKPSPVKGKIPGVVGFKDLSKDHVEGLQSYPQSPPVGGPHNGRWLACDVYDEPVPTEFAVHSLEHGAVWLAYQPGVDPTRLAALQGSTVTTREKVLVSPMEGLSAPVVAVAWGLRLEATGPSDPRLTQFVRAYAGGDQGGEPNAPCAGGGVTAAEAERILDGHEFAA